MIENVDVNQIMPYLVIPFLSGAVGWFTNWLGIKMMMHPTNYVGIGPIGWQGIVPRIRVRLVRLMMQSSIALVCRPREMVAALDDADVVEQISDTIYPQIELWLDDILAQQFGKYWTLAPEIAKRQVYKALKQNMPEIANGVLDDIKDRADLYIDIAEIAALEAEKDPAILPELLVIIANRELKFIVNSGVVFGIPLGIMQAVTFYYWDNSYILPLFGILVGALTNWVALQMLMYPTNPVNILGFKIQGLFLSRQKKVSVDFSNAFAKNFFEIRDVIEYVWNGAYRSEIRAVVNRRLQQTLNKKIFTYAIYTALKLSGDIEIKSEVEESIQNKILQTLGEPEVSKKFLEPISDLVSSRLIELTPKQFQGLLLPVFDQDKWLLVAVGGFLGFCAGLAQLVYIFGDSL